MQEICYYCMRESAGGGVCPLCGKEPSAPGKQRGSALPPGSILEDEKRFLLGEALGQGGFGITYIGMDEETRERVAIKEFYPKHIVTGRRDGVLSIPPDRRQDFDRFLRSFHKEANTIHLLKKNPAIVDVKYLLETNNTAYIVMELLQGLDLHQFVKAAGRLNAHEAFDLLAPIVEALEYIHQNGVLHRDLSPDNIYLCMDEEALQKPRLKDVKQLKLIDFGAAHVAVADFTHSFPGVKKNGYSPLEQNWGASHQGPWTDVYAFAATYYFAITQVAPPSSSDRSGEKDCLRTPKEVGAAISPQAEQVLLKGMAISHGERYQSMKEFSQALQAALYPQKRSTKVPKRNGQEDRRKALRKPPSAVPLKAGPWEGLGLMPRRFLAYGVDWLLWEGSMVLALQWPGVLWGWLLMILANTGLEFVGRHASLGKRLAGLQLCDADSGSRPTLRQCVLHNLCCATLPFLAMEALLMLMTGSCRFMHDQLLRIDVRLAKSTPPPPIAPQPFPSAPSGSLRDIRLLGVAGSVQGKQYHFSQEEVLIGRESAANTLVIPSDDKQVSRRHCTIFRRNGAYYLRDDGSSNGTWLNGEKLSAGEAKQLKDKDILTICRQIFHIKLDA